MIRQGLRLCSKHHTVALSLQGRHTKKVHQYGAPRDMCRRTASAAVCDKVIAVKVSHGAPGTMLFVPSISSQGVPL